MKLKRNQLNYIRPICPFLFLQATNVCSHMSVSFKPIHPSTFKVDSLCAQAMAQHPNLHARNEQLHQNTSFVRKWRSLVRLNSSCRHSPRRQFCFGSSACAIEYVCQLLPLPYTCVQEKSTLCVACHCIATHDRCDTSCSRRSALLLVSTCER